MKHKLFRIAVALVLVCVLVVNVSPIRARAVGVDQFVGVAIDKVGLYAQAGALSTGAAAFAWVLAGLGLIITTAQAIEIMNAYTEFSGELETSIYYYPDGTWSYGVDMGFVDRVRAFLFDEGYLVGAGNLSTTVAEGETYRNYTPRLPCVAYSWSCASLQSDGNTYKFKTSAYLLSMIPGDQYVIAGNKSTACINVNGKKYYAYPIANGSTTISKSQLEEYVQRYPDFYYLGEKTYYLQDVWNEFGWTGVRGSAGMEVGTVAPLEVDIPTGYPEWHTNSRPATNPDTDEEITVLPIPLNPSADPETQIGTLTQPDIWQGSIADPMPDTGTVPDGSIAETPWESFKKWISEGWKSIIQAIPTADSIAQSIGNVIKPIFVPDADFISERWNAIRSRFDFADSISSSGELILDVLNGIDPEPPVIYVDLGDAEGSYYLGGQVAFLDLRWYERYKPTGDAIISAFLWLVFVWRMFIKLPGIIGGLPGDFVMQGVTDLGLADHLPARKKEYENQRQENRRFFKK